ncbi:hypothetical protein LTS08_004474 [Lithohypha guttulata]|nr:hypothetical protein LTS08_004474 [Lithohypha guttulata]
MWHMLGFLLGLLVLCCPTTANAEQTVLDSAQSPQPYRIAIIGAGAAGSSTAYHIRKFAQHDVPINITIFEAENHIGGRTTTINALNDPRYPVELGASIFVEINQILYNATREFGLSATSREDEGTGSAYDLGVWDGTNFVFTLSNGDERSGLKGTLDGWWNMAKIIWRYGLSAVRLQSIRNSVIGRFLRMYDDAFPFQDLGEVLREVDLLPVTGETGPELLKAAGVGERFSREVIQASSRVNYAQNLADFHGLETMVCMSTEGGMSVEGGNWRIFDRMVKEAEAGIHLGAKVHRVETLPNGKSTISYNKSNAHQIDESGFDVVVLAAPYNSSWLTLSPSPSWKPGKVDYVSLHVTLFTSPFRPDPAFFGLKSDQDHLVPDTIFTTLPPDTDPDSLGRGVHGVGPTTFWSLSTLRTINPTTDTYIPPSVLSGHIPAENLISPTNNNLTSPIWPRRAPNDKQYVYKIFSPAPLTAEYLIDLFGWCTHPSLPELLRRDDCTTATNHHNTSKHHSISAIPHALLPWHHEKQWNSYPYMTPRTDFECFDIYSCKDYPAPNVTDGGHDKAAATAWKGKLYYTSPMEAFISAMEASALSGRNIARLIVDRLEGRN